VIKYQLDDSLMVVLIFVMVSHLDPKLMFEASKLLMSRHNK
jgi:hypothetical protein